MPQSQIQFVAERKIAHQLRPPMELNVVKTHDCPQDARIAGWQLSRLHERKMIACEPLRSLLDSAYLMDNNQIAQMAARMNRGAGNPMNRRDSQTRHHHRLLQFAKLLQLTRTSSLKLAAVACGRHAPGRRQRGPPTCGRVVRGPGKMIAGFARLDWCPCLLLELADGVIGFRR